MRVNSILWMTPMIFSTVAFFNQTEVKATTPPETQYQIATQKTPTNHDSVKVGFYRGSPKKTVKNLLLSTPVDYSPTRHQIERLPAYFPAVDVENYYLGHLYRNISGTLIFGRRVPSVVMLER